MPLFEKLDETKLRSLKYGKDTPGGGDSGQPYIKVDLKTVDKNFYQLRSSNFDEGLVRGGLISSLNASVVDTIRVGKFLTDFPKGPLFILKQVGLQLSNPKLETIKLPEGKGVLGFVGRLANFIQDKVGIGPTRIYNLGVNTLAQIPITAYGGHIVRHGLTPIHNENTNYINVVQANNGVTTISNKNLNNFIDLAGGFRTKSDEGETSISNNRLISLKNKLYIYQPRSPRVYLQDKVLVTAPIERIENTIDSYIGGPDSTYGIGRTLIRRFDNTSNLKIKRNLDFQTRDNLELSLSNVNYYSTQGASLIYFSGKETLKIGSNVLGIYNDLEEDNQTKAPTNVNKQPLSADSLQNNLVGQMKNLIFSGGSGLNGSTDRVEAISFQRGDDGKPVIINVNIPYSNNVISYKNSYGDEIKLNRTYAEYNREKRIGSGRKDDINRIPLIYDSKALNKVSIAGVGDLTTRDMIKFRFEAIDTDSVDNSIWMYFRSYLKSFKDNYDADWQKKKYFGRGEGFYKYNGFDRNINFSFKVAALSKEEMEPMFQKLNFLASNITPDYSSQGLMRGPLMKLTIGNYIYREPGILKSLSFEISDETPWEIAIDEPEGGQLMYELPHIIEVNASFTPIHHFLPQKSISESPFILNKAEEEITGAGAVNINNPWLKQKSNNNYTNNNLTAIDPNGKYSQHDK